MRSLIALATAVALSTSAYAAPHSHAGTAHGLGGLGARAVDGYRNRAIYFPRRYQPFWGDYCSNPPFGVLIDPLYYCYPGFYWDYGPPYYWMGYDANTSLPVDSNQTSAAAYGSWKWLTEEKRYAWVGSACTATEPTAGAASGNAR